MFLTVEKLEQLTGRKRPKAQIRWLVDNGYRFRVNASGRPVVLESAVEEDMGGGGRQRKAAPRLDLINDA